MIKLYKTYSIYLFAIMLLSFALQGCMPPDPGIWKNAEIPSGKRDDFHDLNKQLFTTVIAGHPKETEMLFSADLLAGNTNRLIDKIGYHLKNENYSLLDEYYIIHKYQGNQLFKGPKYDLNYTSAAREMYIALFLPKNPAGQSMITVMYAKYNYGWRISSIDVGQYTIGDKTAPDFYKQAVADTAKGYWVNAINNMDLASQCAKPSPVWQYHNETEMNDFYGAAIRIESDKLKLPLTVTSVATAPKIFRIGNQNIAQGNFPYIYYLSTIDLKDTVAIRQENNALKKVIGQVLPGIDKENQYISYSAFNQEPVPSRYVNSYDMTDRLW